MNSTIRKNLLDKNEKLIPMVIERVKRYFYEDIAIIGLTGSFSECINRANEYIDIAKKEYANTLLSKEIGTVGILHVIYYIIQSMH